nr:hypothetical protein [Mycoplasmopsis bovis]
MAKLKYDIRDWNNDHSRSSKVNYSYFGRVLKNLRDLLTTELADK